jgi:hypothetical protein
MSTTPPLDPHAEAFRHHNQQEREARRRRVIAYIKVNTEAVRAAFGIEPPKIELPHRGLKLQ